jgi:hypothetical protein
MLFKKQGSMNTNSSANLLKNNANMSNSKIKEPESANSNVRKSSRIKSQKQPVVNDSPVRARSGANYQEDNMSSPEQSVGMQGDSKVVSPTSKNQMSKIEINLGGS